MPHYAARVDANQLTIVRLLEQLGCAVWDTHALGRGGPDLMVSRNGITVAVEIKDGAKEPARRRLTESENIWRLAWKGTYVILETEDDAIALVAQLRNAD